MSLVDYLNPTSENFFVYKLIELLGDLLKSLFVPSDGYLDEKVNSIKDKFAFIDSINNTIDSIVSVVKNEENVPTFYINTLDNKYYNGQIKVLDLSWYAPYKEYGDTIICCFAYAFFFWRIFINLSNIINGAGGAVDASSEISDIQAYNKFGFGRRSRIRGNRQ